MQIQLGIAGIAALIAVLALVGGSTFGRFRDRLTHLASLIAQTVSELDHERGARAVGPWRYLRRSGGAWAALGLATTACLFGIVACIGLGWSGRPVVTAFLVTGTIYAAFRTVAAFLRMRAGLIRWDRRVLQQRTAMFGIREIAWANVETAKVVRSRGLVWIKAHDGTTIEAPLSSPGIQELVDDLVKLTKGKRG